MVLTGLPLLGRVAGAHLSRRSNQSGHEIITDDCPWEAFQMDEVTYGGVMTGLHEWSGGRRRGGKGFLLAVRGVDPVDCAIM